MVGIMSILKKPNLKKIFLNKTSAISNEKYRNQSKERHIRHMRNRLTEEFDEVWIKYNNNKATYNQWEQALDKWINAELI